MTITEGLAEIKTIQKRIEKQRQFVLEHLFIAGVMRDPLETEGGTRQAVEQARQSIGDLETRIIDIRYAIAKTNLTTVVTAGGLTKSIAAWLTWRRELSEGAGKFLKVMNDAILKVRKEASQKNLSFTDVETTDAKTITVFVKELALAKEIETHEIILGELDGQLSLKNATTPLVVL